ncbi:ribonuclease III [Macrolepiota fuliginosa MF-IS2]|uniref:Ribonuclease III n=1 Tax=Macrolepiota fuliginosa MF-IS2 TaxID=1400762 RepID=A0A9P6C8Q4_9AGAR|nr:ribonuclease III [Macrolepiota fuliginosa MF-IS2]
MSDYPSSQRPRILILIPTLYPDISSESQVTRLKTALDAVVFRTTDAMALSLKENPTDLVIAYERQNNWQETLLYQKLRQCDSGASYLDHHFRNASLALRDLGPCAADLVWRESFKATNLKEEDICTDEPESQSPEVRARVIIKHWPFKLPNLDVTSRNLNVSPKFTRLVELLETYQSYGDSFRGIIFVQKRVIAQLLVALFHSLTPRLQFVRPIAAINSYLSSDHNTVETISHQFTSGQYNLLVATKSYEDVSLPQASVVILFDVFESQVSLAYSRSFTRGQESHLIRMVEQENVAHRHALSRTAFDTKMMRWANDTAPESRGTIPPRPLRERNDSYTSDSEDDLDAEFLQDPVTGSRLRKHQATTIFYRHVAQLTQDDDPTQHLFEYNLAEGEQGPYDKWRCTIRLSGAPIDGFSGPAAPSKYLARREACYAACRQLQHLAQLGSTIFTLDRTRSTEPQDNTMVPQLDSSHEQPHIPLSPDFWKNSINKPTFSEFLYPWIVSTASPGSGLEERAPMCFLTRAPLPEIPHFRLSQSGKCIALQFHRAVPLVLDPEQLELVHKFTVKFCRILMNKPFESAGWREMGYFFVPLKRNWRPPMEIDQAPLPPSIRDVIEWNLVSLVSETWAVPLADPKDLKMDLEDAVVQDRTAEFTHRCEIMRVREDMTPLSEVDDTPLGYSLLKHAAFTTDERFLQGGKTLLEQCHSRRKTFEGLKNTTQPILEVTRLPAAINCLNPRIPPHTEDPKKATQRELPCAPALTLRMGYLLPSIMRRIDEFLLVKQLNAKLLGHCVRDDLLVVATASPLAGNDYDYERLELLGDAFLKYLSSIYVFAQTPSGSEGDLHTARQRYISNQQLCHIASQFGLPGYIQLKPFNIKSWMPPGLKLADVQRKESIAAGGNERENHTPSSQGTTGRPNEDSLVGFEAGKRSKSRKKRPKKTAPSSPIANKTVADVVEAIMGAAYISDGRDAALRAAKALMIPFFEVEEWSDFDRKVRMPYPNASDSLEPSVIRSIEDIICHTFRRPHLLALALAHSTFNNMEMKNHQRLEFIGDAVLDFLVVRYLYNKNQQASPGELSLLKVIMVSNSTLAAICVWSGLYKFINTTPQLAQIIRNYEKALASQQMAEHSQAEKEGRLMGEYWKDLDTPKALSDVVESIIGAVIISDKFSQSGVDAIFENLLQPFYEKYISPQA